MRWSAGALMLDLAIEEGIELLFLSSRPTHDLMHHARDTFSSSHPFLLL
jgi:hypothetical protein